LGGAEIPDMLWLADEVYLYRQRADGLGLKYYVARHYDAQLGRFTSADTIVPGAGNPASWDRYASVLTCVNRCTAHKTRSPGLGVLSFLG
jgi:RHS repeat-associated protein